MEIQNQKRTILKRFYSICSFSTTISAEIYEDEVSVGKSSIALYLQRDNVIAYFVNCP